MHMQDNASLPIEQFDDVYLKQKFEHSEMTHHARCKMSVF